MPNTKTPKIAIVDYGMGNLFSVEQICVHVGMEAEITSSAQKILAADAVILPGVGAFGDAMDTLRRLGLVDVLKDAALSRKPLIGICLGMQLLMSASHEFGFHQGLDIIEGEVIHFGRPAEERGKQLKIPHIGWNRIYKNKKCPDDDPWDYSMLRGIPEGKFMYFVHSFYVKPRDPGLILSNTLYGRTEFCSSLQYQNIFACQFHPERSGPHGLSIYRNIADFIRNNMGGR